jgi:hypothetical protein
MTAFDDMLGTDALPPTPVYPVDRLIGPTGTNGPGSPPAAPATGQSGFDPREILGMLAPREPAGAFNLPAFTSALGAGLSSAGQNWNKPAAAAFASGAGAALQGGQQWQNQLQDAKVKAIHAALAAWKIGDMAALRQQTANLRALTAQERQPAPSAAPGVPAVAGGAPTNNPPAPPPSVTGSPSGPTVYGSPTASAAAPPLATDNASARLSAPDALAKARDAIARGAPRDAVLQRLRERNYDPSGL